MINDVTEVWKSVVDRMFRGEDGLQTCVEGSTGDKSSVSGGGQARGGESLPPVQQGGLPHNTATTEKGGQIWSVLAATCALLLLL
jgi:hypothetical protein